MGRSVKPLEPSLPRRCPPRRGVRRATLRLLSDMAERAVAYYSISSSPGSAAARQEGERVAAFVRRRRWVLVEPFVERDGRERPQLREALNRCAALGAILVVPSMAALGRDRVFLDAVLETRVRLAAIDRPRLSRTSLELLREVARERSARASARSREALRRARLRGVRIGSPRPEVGAARAGEVLRQRADARARALAPLLEELQLSNPGIGLRGIAQLLSEQGVPTPRGGRWGPSTVKSVLDRNRVRDAGSPSSGGAQSGPGARAGSAVAE